MKIKLLIFFIFTAINISLPQTLTGTIKNLKGESLPSANIILMGSNIGVSSNADGKYLLKLPRKKNIVIVKYLGYKDDTLHLEAKGNEEIKKDFLLEELNVELEQVTVYASPYTSAELIILKTIEKKNDYLSNLKNYSYDAYTKTIMKLRKGDSVRIGGILETQSSAYFEYPDQFQEKIIAKRQTSNFTETQNIFTIGQIPNILWDIITIDELSVISPLNNDALKYYAYELGDTSFYKDIKVFNIKFRPKSNIIPLFSGVISIIEKSYVPNRVSLDGGGRLKSSSRENIKIDQHFREYENNYWLPVNVEYSFDVSMGIPSIPPIAIQQNSLISNYTINSKSFDHQFDRSIVTQSLLPAGEQNKVWEQNQIIPLSEEEGKAWLWIDSIMSSSNVVMKSIIFFSNLLIYEPDLPVSKFSDFYRFNSTEGSYIGAGLDSRKILDPLDAQLKFGYGLSDRKYKYAALLGYSFSKFDRLSVSFFDDIFCLPDYYDFSRFDLTYQSLFYKNDYAEYLYKRGVKISGSFLVADKLNLNVGLSSERHSAAKRNSDYSFFNRDKNYEPPMMTADRNFSLIDISLRYDSRKYYDLGWMELPDNSQGYSVARFNYLAGTTLLNGENTFQRYQLMLEQYFKLTPFLNFKFVCEGGILNNSDAGNFKFIFPSSFGTFSAINSFRILENQKLFGEKYAALYFENDFRNVLFNLLNVPFLKESRYNFHVFLNNGFISNTLFSNDSSEGKITKRFSEAGFGIGNLLTFFRVDFVWNLRSSTDRKFSVNVLTNF